ncbi:hypothetical protein JW964_09315 [candidate division KSB1 bacterium]|nr:hypothetical protein [candidate division KSB1 bacterium]
MLYRTVIILILLSCLVFSTSLISAENEVLSRDIDIMEVILDKLIFKDGTSSFGGRSTQGYYLGGYGVIFYVPYKDRGVSLFTLPESKTGKYVTPENLTTGYVLELGKEENKKWEDRYSTLKENLAIFFKDYANVIKGLNSQDRITVVVGFNGSASFIGLDGTKNDEKVKQLTASMPFHKMQSLRQSSMDNKAFMNEISFTEEKGDAAGKQDLNILADIFHSAFTKKMKTSRFDLNVRPRCTYFPGFGALFMINSQSSSFLMTHLADEYLVAVGEYEKQKTNGKTKPDAQDSKKKADDYVSDVQEEIIDILATYGGTVRSVPEQEQVMVVVEFGSSQFNDLPNKLSIKAKMSDIQKVAKDKMSKQEFKKSIEIKEY